MHTTVIILHVGKPSFSLPFAPDARLKPVAAMYIPKSDNPNLNDLYWLDWAFRATNSVDGPWHDPTTAAANGLNVLKASRSTSVGDAVIILDETGARAYACDSVGWTPIATPVTL